MPPWMNPAIIEWFRVRGFDPDGGRVWIWRDGARTGGYLRLSDPTAYTDRFTLLTACTRLVAQARGMAAVDKAMGRSV